VEPEKGRKAARRSWPARVIRPGDVSDDDDLSLSTTPEERVAMMWFLAEQAWAFARRPLPAYDRSAMPARVIRGGQGAR
jgi:MOSC domain-containing protein YiiM